jgi:hypothetical protein
MSNVRGHFRKDGTWVRPHRRRRPLGVGVAAAVTVGGIVTVAVSLSTGTTAPKPSASSRAPRSVQAIPAEAQAGFQRSEAALVAAGYRTSLATKFDADCAANSYGKVRDFFRSNPCQWLARADLETAYPEILIAIYWVGMPSASLAEKYKRLVDTPGSGGVTELSRDIKRYRKIEYAGSAHTSGIKGSAVWNVQVKPIYPRPTAEITKILIDSRQ